MRQPQEYDSHEEYEEAQETAMRKQIAKKRGGAVATAEPAVPQPIVFEAAIRHWAEQYEAVSIADSDTEFWTVGEIRELLFGMVPFGGLDPMDAIKAVLEQYGIRPVANPAFGGLVYQLRKQEDVIIRSTGSDIETESTDHPAISLF